MEIPDIVYEIAEIGDLQIDFPSVGILKYSHKFERLNLRILPRVSRAN